MDKLLWLIRHAQPRGVEGLCYGAHDAAAGEEETRLAARELAGALPRGIRLRVSPLRRCLQLARGLEALRPDLRAQTDARLAEMNFGAWENHAWDSIAREEIDAWAADFRHYRPGGAGETAAEVFSRVAAALDDARRAEGAQAWITHAGVIKAATLLIRGDGPPAEASGWPRTGPRWGEWQVLALAA